ncbi:hypothetical protein KC865_04120 [Candidatus Kaiserbacteria bacterium]|nr:hypothetical protein [Candidatus Kaiserbacteria bacterium]
MNQKEHYSQPKIPVPISQKILNKTFYRFFFSFIAVIAGVLLLILVVGVGGGL